MHIKKERRCIVCRKPQQQNEMLRIAKINKDFIIDDKNKLGGRGAYICKNKECINTAIKKRTLNRAFKMQVDSSIYEKLGEYEQNI